MKYLYLILSIILFTDCSGQNNKTTVQEEEYKFKMITIPSTLTFPEDRAAYLVKHYWDNFNFADTVFFLHKDVIEQSFVDYVDVFPYTTQTIVEESIHNMLKKAEGEGKVFDYFVDLYEKYLYEPNSPMRNDEYYIPVLESAISSSLPKDKTRYRLLLEMVSKNRTGNTAANFTYTLPDGHKGTLHNLNADYTLIFFYNPDCQNCKDVAAQLKNSESIISLQTKGRIKILAIYSDKDLSAWRQYLPQMPREWVVAYDEKQAIDMDGLYDLKAIPSLYLLDKYKKVLLKDATFEQVEEYFSDI